MVQWTGVSTPQLGQLNINKFTIMEECKKRNLKHKRSALKKKNSSYPPNPPAQRKDNQLSSPSSLRITVRHPSLPDLHFTTRLCLWHPETQRNSCVKTFLTLVLFQTSSNLHFMNQVWIWNSMRAS